MKRSAYDKLLDWKKSDTRKPLVLQGARQVGKTFLVKEFGTKEYQNFYYLNFEEDKNLVSLFQNGYNTDQIIQDIGLYLGEKITAENTILFFDEIQVAPEVLTCLKYFNEQNNQYHIIAAGSLLGVSVGKQSSFPVGKVNFLTLYPLSFQEYLIAIGENLIVDYLNNLTTPNSLPDAIHNKLMEQLKTFLFIGGMPEVVQNYIDNKDIKNVRTIQNEILEAYNRDFSKYADKTQAIRNSEFWNSVPSQLGKENKKFKYRDINKSARANKYENAIEWLHKAGLINIVYHISTPKIPLISYTDYSKFKVFFHDVGLLGAKLSISSRMIVSPNELFTEFNGAFIENFVAQELKYFNQNNLFYWTSRSDAEVDFILESESNIYPIEVKSGLSKNLKSLRSYADKYNPEVIFRISPRNMIQTNNFINIPLYAIHLLKSFTADQKKTIP